MDGTPAALSQIILVVAYQSFCGIAVWLILRVTDEWRQPKQ